MLSVLLHTSLDEQVHTKISMMLVSFVGREIDSIAAQTSKSLKNALEAVYAANTERILIYQSTIRPSSLFNRETPYSFKYIKLAGGYSNFTFKVCLSAGISYISRIPGNGTELFIDRRAEWHNACIAAELGLNPPILVSDKQGSQLSLYVDQAQPLQPELLHRQPHYLADIALQLRTLHQSEKKFYNDANSFQRIKAFYTLIQQKKYFLPAAYLPIGEATVKLAELFVHLNIPQVPCHNDTYYNNFLLSKGRLWLIDWEYSGTNDPIWDLAYFANLAGLNAQQKQSLLTAYFQCDKIEDKYSLEYLRFIAYELVICDFLILWTYVQLGNNNTTVPEKEYQQWGEQRIKKGLQVLHDEVFINAVQRLKQAAQSAELLAHTSIALSSPAVSTAGNAGGR